MKIQLQLIAIAFLGAFSATSLKAQGVCFLPQTTFTTGVSPLGTTCGDFNGDGKQDIAVTSQAQNNVSILLGTGTGSFSPATTFTAGTQPCGIINADFNGDGKLDLAITNLAPASASLIAILMGNGIGGFGPVTNFTVGPVPQSIASGDFNGDGKVDLVATNGSSINVSVLIGTGTGSFLTSVSYSTGTSPYAIAVGDFNSDGKSDLATANYNSNDVSVLLGSGTGTFSTFATITVSTNPRGIACGDFNSDGKPDLSVTNNGANSISILLGTGNGSFVATTSLVAVGAPRGMAIGDFNSDGKKDVAVVSAGTNSVLTFLGNGAGGFGAVNSFTIGGAPTALSICDFNNDGKPDVVAANQAGANVSILINSAPSVSVNTTKILLCTNETATITASGATTYTWNTGPTTTAIVVSPTINTSYTVVGSDNASCQGGKVFVQTVDPCLGIQQFGITGTELNVYPNPFNKETFVNLQLTSNAKVQMILFNALGQVIDNLEDKNLESGNYSYNINVESKGIYILKTNVNGVVSTKKIIHVE